MPSELLKICREKRAETNVSKEPNLLSVLLFRSYILCVATVTLLSSNSSTQIDYSIKKFEVSLKLEIERKRAWETCDLEVKMYMNNQ